MHRGLDGGDSHKVRFYSTARAAFSRFWGCAGWRFAALAPDPAAAARFKLRLRAGHGEPFSAGRADPPSERSETRALAKPKPAGAAEAAAARARAALAAEQAGREAEPAGPAISSDRATICIAGC